jgi:hypothetical protein
MNLLKAGDKSQWNVNDYRSFGEFSTTSNFTCINEEYLVFLYWIKFKYY